MTPHNPPTPSHYRPDIDGLRAIAISSVVFYHAGLSGFTGGFVGVDVFFVISGFLITKLLLTEIEKTGSISFSNFYSRRMKRLIPAFLAMMLGTLALILLVTPGLEDTQKFSASIKWSAIGLANIFFKRNTSGYFDGPSEEMPLLHLWSLAVEEQFYFFWPLLLMIPVWLLGKKDRARKITPWLLGVTTLGSFISAAHLMKHHQTSDAFYLMPHRAWELGIGGLLGLSNSNLFHHQNSSRLSWILAPFGLISVLYGILSYHHQTPFPGFTALAPVLGTAALIFAGHRGSNPISNFLSNRVFIRIGVLSYGWYLWHWPLLVLLKIWNLGAEPPKTERILVMLLALLLAELSLRFVETPVRTHPFWKGLSSKKTILIGVCISLILGLTGFLFSRFEDSLIASRVGAPILQKVWETSSLGGKCFSKDEVGSDSCTLHFAADQNVIHEIAVWGDSHACSYFPLFEHLGREHHLNVTQYCQGQTPPFSSGAEDSFDGAVFRDLRKKIAAGKKVSLVMVARWVPYTGKRPISLETHDFPNFGNETQSLSEIKRRLTETILQLKQVGVNRVMIILPYPEFKYRTLRCLLRKTEPCLIDRNEIDEYRAPMVMLLQDLAKHHSGVSLLDPLPAVCNSKICPQVFDDIPVTSDTNHPSVSAVQWIGKLKSAELKQWIESP